MPLLLAVLEESFYIGCLPQSFYQATISVLPKKGKDPLNCSSFRPISLLNVDCKILAKVLARRLENVLPTILAPDQTGFIKKKRFSFFNIRRVFDIIYSPDSHENIPEILISLDAKKAFDRVEWSFLFSCLERFGVGQIFLTWVKL